MKGRQALLMREKARKKAVLIAERDRIAFEQYLSKERERLLKRKVEMERNADDGGEASQAHMFVEVDMNGWETGSEGEIPERPYLNVRTVTQPLCSISFRFCQLCQLKVQSFSKNS